jgi:hypothetical protein
MGRINIVISNLDGDALIAPTLETREENYNQSMALNVRSQLFIMQKNSTNKQKRIVKKPPRFGGLSPPADIADALVNYKSWHITCLIAQTDGVSFEITRTD